MSEANITPVPTATKILLEPSFQRQISISLRHMGKTWEDIESGDVLISFVEQASDPRSFALVLRCKDAPEPRVVNPEDFR